MERGKQVQVSSLGDIVTRAKLDRKFDVLIIGGGPNGLTAGAYLAKAGQRVLI